MNIERGNNYLQASRIFLAKGPQRIGLRTFLSSALMCSLTANNSGIIGPL